MSRPVLAVTSIGKHVNKHTKSNDSSVVADKSRKLGQHWKDKANAEKVQSNSKNEKYDVFAYTILVFKGKNQSQVEENVLSDRVTQRRNAKMSTKANMPANCMIKPGLQLDC